MPETVRPPEPTVEHVIPINLGTALDIYNIQFTLKLLIFPVCIREVQI